MHHPSPLQIQATVLPISKHSPSPVLLQNTKYITQLAPPIEKYQFAPIWYSLHLVLSFIRRLIPLPQGAIKEANKTNKQTKKKREMKAQFNKAVFCIQFKFKALLLLPVITVSNQLLAVRSEKADRDALFLESGSSIISRMESAV